MTAYAPGPLKALRDARSVALANIKFKEGEVASKEMIATTAAANLRDAQSSLDAERRVLRELEDTVSMLGFEP